jgi:hypothetical protein
LYDPLGVIRIRDTGLRDHIVRYAATEDSEELSSSGMNVDRDDATGYHVPSVSIS